MSNGASLARLQPPPFLEIVAEPEDDAEHLDEPTLVRSIPRSREDEPTQPFNFDPPTPQPDEKLVIGYLTMEANGMFAGLSIEEQERIARTLRR